MLICGLLGVCRLYFPETPEMLRQGLNGILSGELDYGELIAAIGGGNPMLPCEGLCPRRITGTNGGNLRAFRPVHRINELSCYVPRTHNSPTECHSLPSMLACI